MATIIAEIGINANGSVANAKRLIDVAKKAGADYVKFQKRDIESTYTPMELEMLRQTPFGTTNGDLKRALEFDRYAYDAIDDYCKSVGIGWTASVWDAPSLDFLLAYNPPFIKVPSARVRDLDLLHQIALAGHPIVMSTGMSTLPEIRTALGVLARFNRHTTTLLACTSTYPCSLDEVNLRQIGTLRYEFGLPVGFSSHSKSPWPILGAVALGACMIEAHITLDRTMFGTDQAASLEPGAFTKVCLEVRDMETALGDGVKYVYKSELPIRNKLDRVTGGLSCSRG